MKVRCHECGGVQKLPRDPFCIGCDEDLRPLEYVEEEELKLQDHDPEPLIRATAEVISKEQAADTSEE